MSERINLGDSVMDIMMKMSDGNPGAIRVLMELFNKGAIIDPDDFLGGLGAILSLDTYGIYGSNIWILYKDICDEDIVKTLATLRAAQLGFFSIPELRSACSEDSYEAKTPIPVDDLLVKVKERLPKFGQAAL